MLFWRRIGWLLGAALFVMGDGAAAQGPTDSNALRNPLSQELPEWVDLRFNSRTRLERRGGINFADPFDDGLLLSRLRLQADLRHGTHVRSRIQIQDSRSGWLADGRSRTGTDNPVDLRQAFVEFGAPAPLEGEPPDGWSLRAGRQLLYFGDERILAERNWNNVAPAWDGARLRFHRGGSGVDVFAAAQVDNDVDEVDPPLSGARIVGVFGRLAAPGGKTRLEPYWLYNATPRIGGREVTHDAGIHTAGSRLLATKSRWDFEAEAAIQRGEAPGVRQLGWMGLGRVGYQPARIPWQARLYSHCQVASGDGDPDDGVVHTFDVGLGKRHAALGIADAVGRSNLRLVEAGAEARPRRGLLVTTSYFRFDVDQRRDGLYRPNGLLAIEAPAGGASGAHLGDEVEIFVEWQASEILFLEAGAGRFFSGEFLNEAAGGERRRSILYLSVEVSL